MGYYGVKPGPFIFLPLIGATTLRDAFGAGLDRLVLPIVVGMPFNQLAYAIATGTISSLDSHIQFDDQLRKLREESADPYIARRDLYLKMRQAEIDELRGKRSMITALEVPPQEPSGAPSPAVDQPAPVAAPNIATTEQAAEQQSEPKVLSISIQTSLPRHGVPTLRAA